MGIDNGFNQLTTRWVGDDRSGPWRAYRRHEANMPRSGSVDAVLGGPEVQHGTVGMKGRWVHGRFVQ